MERCKECKKMVGMIVAHVVAAHDMPWHKYVTKHNLEDTLGISPIKNEGKTIRVSAVLGRTVAKFKKDPRLAKGGSCKNQVDIAREPTRVKEIKALWVAGVEIRVIMEAFGIGYRTLKNMEREEILPKRVKKGLGDGGGIKWIVLKSGENKTSNMVAR